MIIENQIIGLFFPEEPKKTLVKNFIHLKCFIIQGEIGSREKVFIYLDNIGSKF